MLSLRDIAFVLEKADPVLKAQVYAELGVEVSYDPGRRMVFVSAGPTRVQQSVSERRLLLSRPISTPAAWAIRALPSGLWKAATRPSAAS